MEQFGVKLQKLRYQFVHANTQIQRQQSVLKTVNTENPYLTVSHNIIRVHSFHNIFDRKEVNKIVSCVL